MLESKWFWSGRPSVIYNSNIRILLWRLGPSERTPTNTFVHIHRLGCVLKKYGGRGRNELFRNGIGSIGGLVYIRNVTFLYMMYCS